MPAPGVHLLAAHPASKPRWFASTCPVCLASIVATTWVRPKDVLPAIAWRSSASTLSPQRHAGCCGKQHEVKGKLAWKEEAHEEHKKARMPVACLDTSLAVHATIDHLLIHINFSETHSSRTHSR